MNTAKWMNIVCQYNAFVLTARFWYSVMSTEHPSRDKFLEARALYFVDAAVAIAPLSFEAMRLDALNERRAVEHKPLLEQIAYFDTCGGEPLPHSSALADIVAMDWQGII